jgi:hypothetical protein
MMKNHNNIKFLFLIILSLFISSVYSQIIKLPDYSIQTGATLSAGKQTPFWLLSNQYGLITPDKFNGWIKLGFKTSLSAEKNFDYDYGLEIIDRQSNKNKLYLHQVYLRLKLHFVDFQIGSVEEKFGDQDSSISSGGLLWSGNARPMPKISLIVRDYSPIPLTRGYIEFKGGISHGWFGNNEFVNNAWLHHKYFYIRLGGKLPVKIHYGIHHFAQWGGFSADTSVGQMPNGFDDFVRVFFAKPGDENAPTGEQKLPLGNHLASRDLGLNIDFKGVKISFYNQTLFEDRSSEYWGIINKTALWGIIFHLKDKNRFINKFGYEFLNISSKTDPKNYFNHGYYRFGWTFYDMTIGTPMITSPIIIQNTETEGGYIWNNEVTAHHLGMAGKYKNLQYKFFATYSLNYGTPSYPYDPALNQFSFLLEILLSDKLPLGIQAGFAVGYDHGDLLGNNTGLRISLTKQGSLDEK